MRFNVAQLLKESIGRSRYYEIDETMEVIDGADGSCRIKGEAELLRTDRGILVRGKLDTSVRCVCSRCLEVFVCPLSLEISEEFFPTVDVITGLPLQVPQEDNPFTIDEKHTLDLSEAVRQYALLSLPMKLVCRPDCAGLCPNCGANLNIERCRCSAPTPDPRWAKLNELASSGGLPNTDKERD
jgi:uncharacterized protein